MIKENKGFDHHIWMNIVVHIVSQTCDRLKLTAIIGIGSDSLGWSYNLYN